MPLNDEHVDATDVILGKQKVIVSVHGHWIYLLVIPSEQNLVVVAIYNQTVSSALLNIIRAIVIIYD